MDITITYEDLKLKKAIDAWADDHGFDAVEQIRCHFEIIFERFRAKSIHLTAVEDRGDFLRLSISAAGWEKAKEFALMSDGRLSW